MKTLRGSDMSNKHPNGYYKINIDDKFIGMHGAVSIGTTKNHFLKFYKQHYNEKWTDVLEVRANGKPNSSHDTIKNDLRNLNYTHTDVIKNPYLDTVIWDFESRSPFEDNSFDVVFSNQSLEHTKKPWIICDEIKRVMRKGGIVYVRVPWAWRYHPAPIDYWRFSPECLINLFDGFETIEANFDCYGRRRDIRGHWPNKKDSVPIDSMGGWREHWQTYYVGKKV